MSEKFYAWLLRLYPSHFQKAYGDEALQLFRDRARDERGFLPRLRLWLDLLSDLAISIPREYRAAPAALVASPAPRSADGTPSFHILEDETLSVGSLLYGGIASLVVYSCLVILVSHGGKPIPFVAPDLERAPRYSGAIAKPTPTVTISYRPTNPMPGATITLTAKVSVDGNGPTPTGHVRFFDGSAILNTAKLDDGAVTVKGKLLHTATHSIHAIYYGDLNYRSAVSTDEQQMTSLKWR